MHHNKDLNKFKIVMVEGATNFLPGLPAKVANIVSERMKDFGIETRFSSLITEVAKDSVTLNMKEKIPYDLLIWTGGVRSCQLPLDVEVSLDKKSRVEAQATLSLKNYPNVFVAGDNACVDNPITGKPVGQTAQEAIAQGKLVAKNIFRLIKQKPLLPYHASPTRFIIPVTGKYAIFYSPNLIISGFPGWIVRKAADLRYFLSVLPFGKAISYWLFENKIFMKND